MRGEEMNKMPDIRLVRVDFRLMHGQVVTAWLKQVSANAILIVDDQLAAEVFQLPFVHERLILGRTIIVWQEGFGFHRSTLPFLRMRCQVGCGHGALLHGRASKGIGTDCH